MKKARLAISLLVAVLLWPGAARAQDENRAGLLVLHGDGRVVQQCVTFTEETISGYELLQRAGGALSVEAGAMGATVCSIDGEGCSYPAESCFCRCQGSPCVYWSYWRLQEDGAWRYQPLGAGNTRVQNGDVEAWRWAEGTRQSAPEPPPITFERICAPADAQASASAEPIAQASASAQPTARGSAAGDSLAQASTSAPQEEDAPTALWLLLGAALALPAAVLLLWAIVQRARVRR